MKISSNSTTTLAMHSHDDETTTKKLNLSNHFRLVGPPPSLKIEWHVTYLMADFVQKKEEY